jgi:F0F1-type ATP synthase assembly protein I
VTERYRDVQEIMAAGRDKRQAGRAHLYALEIPISFIFCVVVGSVVDRKFGVAPWGVGVGIFLGVASAARAVLGLIRWQRDNEALEAKEEAARAAQAKGGSDD